MKKLLILLVAGFAFAGCSTMKPSGDKNMIELSGKIQKSGMTTYQYGSHTIQSGDKTYALKSTAVDLDTFADKDVVLKGTKVAGYPVENGPDLIDVKEVKIK
ncbi:hypothetical protein [Pedobacter steynii]|uniref:Lipoprotein n=1 Tax=Pedobacter steynii TaxID=430522 RepID=A0A1D7QKL2_9SPHI|nr:hypothetical protein [Pedobacter steynii]AOM79215.1 hypothetical protein BFS30_19810 [Pedobacter steynii]